MDESVSYQLNNESNIPFLRELAGKKGTFIEKITDTMHIGLLPSTLGKLKSGILDSLNSMLRKYDPKLDGILVGYDNLAMLGSNGHMIPGYHHIHINIRADFYVFKPVVGGTLTGTVLKKSESNATCLTNKVFTVFVSFPSRVKHSLHRVQLHKEISFTIEKVDLLSQIPFVKGVLNEDSLPSGGSNIIRFDSPEPAAEPDSGLSSIEDGSLGPSPASTSDTPRPRKHKKRRDRERPFSVDGEPALVKTEVEEEEELTRRKSKKRRREETEETEEQQEQEQTSPRKAKKRRHHDEQPVTVKQELYLADPELPSAAPPATRRKSAAPPATRRKSRVRN